MGALLHWLNVELWSPMWPNMFAPSLTTVPVVIAGHVRASRQRQRNHEDMKKHVTAQSSTENPHGSPTLIPAPEGGPRCP